MGVFARHRAKLRRLKARKVHWPVFVRDVMVVCGNEQEPGEEYRPLCNVSTNDEPSYALYWEDVTCLRCRPTKPDEEE